MCSPNGSHMRRRVSGVFVGTSKQTFWVGGKRDLLAQPWLRNQAPPLNIFHPLSSTTHPQAVFWIIWMSAFFWPHLWHKHCVGGYHSLQSGIGVNPLNVNHLWPWTLKEDFLVSHSASPFQEVFLLFTSPSPLPLPLREGVKCTHKHFITNIIVCVCSGRGKPVLLCLRMLRPFSR